MIVVGVNRDTEDSEPGKEVINDGGRSSDSEDNPAMCQCCQVGVIVQMVMF